jgi:sugar lactone lactonase YvrE
MPAVECLWPLAAKLGEGPLWRASENALWFVDIKGERLHRLDLASGARRSYDAPAQPGFVLPVADGGLLCGLKTGLHRFDPAQGKFDLLDAVSPRPEGTRLNDGHVDAQGRLWFGTMDDDEARPTGALYRLEAGGAKACDPFYVITNGPATSPDGRTLYHVDTLERLIYAFDLAEDGAISGKRVLTKVAPGYPDGIVVDGEGCIWTGLFGGFGLNRYAPSGKLLEFLPLPCANVTKAAFGDSDLRTLYITTAWKGLDDAARAAQPLAGGLFAVRVATPGLAQNEIRHGV